MATMSQTNHLLVHDSSPTHGSIFELHDVEQEISPGSEVPASRPSASNKQKASVLIGAGLSQLPIWGFAMTYGVFQEYYTNNWTLQGNLAVTGIIGTTSNGVMYLSMPFLFTLFTRKWAHRRQTAALCGVVLACLSFLVSSFSTEVWHLVLTQGIMAALGCALVYSPTTLSLGEWFNNTNRALAYGVTLSCKNVVGSTCPFLIRVLLDKYGFRDTLRVWTGIVALTGILSIILIPTPQSTLNLSSSSTDEDRRPKKIPWSFLRHQTFYIFSIAIILQSSGYGIPQTYLNTYAHDVAQLSQTSATLLLTLFNVPGIASSSFFGYLSSSSSSSSSTTSSPNPTSTSHTRRRNPFKIHFILRPLSASTTTFISSLFTALSALLFWGFASPGSLTLLILFSVTFGFFAGGYSATWGGIINQMEREAGVNNEAIDLGVVYGLLNGARGVGYVGGGLVGVPLLRVGGGGGGNTMEVVMKGATFGYATKYGPLIVFTGLCSIFGGWGIIWDVKRRVGRVW